MGSSSVSMFFFLGGGAHYTSDTSAEIGECSDLVVFSGGRACQESGYRVRPLCDQQPTPVASKRENQARTVHRITVVNLLCDLIFWHLQVGWHFLELFLRFL